MVQATCLMSIALGPVIKRRRLLPQVVDGPPLGADQEEPEALELLSGHVPQDSLTKNQQPLQLSALQVPGLASMAYGSPHLACHAAG